MEIRFAAIHIHKPLEIKLYDTELRPEKVQKKDALQIWRGYAVSIPEPPLQTHTL